MVRFYLESSRCGGDDNDGIQFAGDGNDLNPEV